LHNENEAACERLRQAWPETVYCKVLRLLTTYYIEKCSSEDRIRRFLPNSVNLGHQSVFLFR